MPPAATKWVAFVTAMWPAFPGLGVPTAAPAGLDHRIVCLDASAPETRQETRGSSVWWATGLHEGL